MSKHSSNRRINLWKIGWLILVLGSLGLVPSGQTARAINPYMVDPDPSTGASTSESIFDSPVLFIPLVKNEGEENTDPRPIWSHMHVSALHEVNLFRKTFTIEETLKKASLQIFADTRYMVWLDGVWIGRGPARFSKLTREYDVYALGDLDPGEHVIAVLVQWAPNNRRSESTTPYLLAHIEGSTSEGHSVKAATGSFWKALSPNAWRQDAALVHTWGLIGPTELLDFRQLPLDWMKLEYSDSGWQQAIVKDISTVEYHLPQVPRIDPSITFTSPPPLLEPSPARLDIGSVNFLPRSLPHMERVNIPIQVLDAGTVSPGKRISEIDGTSPERTIRVTALDETPITLETVAIDGPPNSEAYRLDGRNLNWAPVGASRPDVYAASKNLDQGEHTLKIYNIPKKGVTISVTEHEIWTNEFPFQQGVHAGRRSLLAELVSSDGVVSVDSGDSLDITFNNFPSYVVFDLGRTVHGRLVAEVKGPPGTIVDIGWDERLSGETNRPLPYPGSLHPQWNQVDSWILDGNYRQLSTLDTRAGRYILVLVWGDGPVEFNDIQVLEERLPLEQTGWFESTDPLLNQIWQLGVDTLYSNMTDAYADPWRERGQWWGDAYVIDHANRVSFGDDILLRRGLLFMAQAITGGQPNAIAPNGDGSHMLDYGMLWVQSLRDYVQRTGDIQILEEAYSPLVDLMSYLEGYENPSTGMLDIPKGPWHETTYIDTIGVQSRYGQSTAVNAMYYRTLMDSAYLAEQKMDIAHAVAWRQDAATLKEEIHSQLYMPAKHLYLSSLLDGEPIAPSPHAQAWALSYGVVPEKEIPSVAESLVDILHFQPETPDVEIYGTYWVLEALGRAAKIDEAIRYIKAYYGHLIDSGARTTWEVYNADNNFRQSLSHGWGSSATWFLTTYLLGAQKTDSNEWVVKPAFQGGNVTSVSGALPLGDGILEVSWEIKSCDNYQLTISSPIDYTGKVLLPDFGESMEVSLDGFVIWSQGLPSGDSVIGKTDGIQIIVEGGEHLLSVFKICQAGEIP